MRSLVTLALPRPLLAVRMIRRANRFAVLVNSGAQARRATA